MNLSTETKLAEQIIAKIFKVTKTPQSHPLPVKENTNRLIEKYCHNTGISPKYISKIIKFN